jgi:squalene-hopene/tetraprenyl-beta-curcumene cyclase
MEAEWLLAFHILGIDSHPLKAGLIQGILDRQRTDGSWEVFFQAPNGDINATVECYAALKACGLPRDHPQLSRARAWILSSGGLSRIRVFTRYWLALIGEWPWQKTPNLPPEIIFFPSWFPFCIYHFASWARATMVPLFILSSRQPVRPLAHGQRLDELFPQGRDNTDYRLPKKEGLWFLFFSTTDKMLHGYQRWFNRPPLRNAAVKHCLEWVIKHQDADGGWGGIQPPWVYGLMALHTEGYPLNHPVMTKGLSALSDHWSFERDGATYIQASESPVWDTLLAALAMLDCDLAYGQNTAIQQAIDWILDQQVLTPGDWQVKLPGVAPGGWAFERANQMYPDVDDTAVALMVLAQLREQYPDRKRLDQAIDLGTAWLLAMQSSDGGWAAFDRDNNKALLTKIPFSDFGETLDPPSVDVTAHVLEALGMLQFSPDHPVVKKALGYVFQEQEPEGSWFGRWGVNYIYGTAAVLPALRALGWPMEAANIQRAADWIEAHQNNDGGWGESCASYMDDALRGRGESTASQTAWALLALVASGQVRFLGAIEKGLAYLFTTQTAAGSWDEAHYTGTGFPGYGAGKKVAMDPRSATGELQQGAELSRGFMINYNLYRHYFPLMAMGRARRFINQIATGRIQ